MVAQTPPGLVRFTVQRVSGEWILAVPDADVAVLEASHQRLREELAAAMQLMRAFQLEVTALRARQQEAERLLRELIVLSWVDPIRGKELAQRIDAYLAKEPA